MQMRVDAATAKREEREAKLRLFEAQELSEKRSNKSRSSRGGKKKGAGQQSSGSVTKLGCGTATPDLGTGQAGATISGAKMCSSSSLMAKPIVQGHVHHLQA